ncbi:MAG: hypothetical protein WBM00_07070 [Solirubrobacterales bacterium]
MQTFEYTLRRRLVARGVAIAIMTLLSCAASATGARAAAVYKVVGTQGNGLNVRTAPRLGAGLLRNLPEGTAITIECQTRGDTVGSSTMWDKISQPVSGYLADWYTTTPVVNNPSPGLPACGSPPPLPPTPTPTPTPPPATTPAPMPHAPTVTELALSYNGQRVIPVAFARRFGLGRYWSGYCEAFVGLVAYHEHGYSTAMADYVAHKRLGKIHTTGIPPSGAVIYWNPANNNIGHVGISLGAGKEISTYGFAGDSYPIQIHPYRYFAGYLGWAMP